MRTVHLLGLCGSLRHASSNAVVLRTLATELTASCVHLCLHPLDELPLYNSDLEGVHLPAAVQALRDAVEQCEGVVLATPEYSHGMSGVMKNALDWLSGPCQRSPLKGKPALAFTASGAFTGGSRAQQQLSETLWAAQAEPVTYPQIVITDVEHKIRDGRLTDPATRRFLADGMIALEDSIRQVSPLGATLTWA